MRRLVRYGLCACSVGALVAALVLLLRTPSNERNWVEAAARLSDATVHETGVVVTNVRDWEYDAAGVTGKRWIDTVELPFADLVRVWFVLEPFSAKPKVGHSFLTFEFRDGSAYSFSVEARREQGEDYVAWRGLFRAYELKYAWGTERDFLTRRLFMLGHPLYVYPLELSSEDARGVLRALGEATHALHETPRFYNTLTANCTNMLAKIINERYPDTVPYDLSWNFPGWSDRFLIREGYIASGGSLEAARAAADLTKRYEVLYAARATSSVGWSALVRRGLE